MLYALARPLLFRLDAERAHRLALAAIGTMPRLPSPRLPRSLETKVAGLAFPNPVGLAAGFDKDGTIAHLMGGFGFGFAELGTLTPLPQTGNPQPRLFRLVEDRAVINRMGFNNGGQAAAAERLAGRRARIPIGINIGANKDAPDRIADYATGVRTMAPLADYLTINISSPNTPGLRALQDAEALDGLLGAVMDARDAPGPPNGSRLPPIFLKVAPDLLPADVDAIARAAYAHRIDALIVSNTTIARPALRSRHAGEAGGLSGAPLKGPALEMLRAFRAAAGPDMPLIGVGGIETAEDAYARIRAGASLVQFYSAMVFEGPFLARRIAAGIAKLLERDGFAHVADAVGIDA
jgi:dihydroorotate dehydrogenase